MYDEAFFEDETKVAWASVKIVGPWVIDRLGGTLDTVIDVGGGTGAWAAHFHVNGVTTLNIDQYAPPGRGLGARLYADISNGIDCTGWDLAICLEVAEHLPSTSAEPLVAGLAKAGTVLWSAATPGQPGVGHIHCQPPEYWAALFAQHGMVGEYIGDQFGPPVADFYVRNLYLYAKAAS